MKKYVKKAIIPAAGLGTRFLPATKSQPKEMLPIVDKPTLQYIIEEAIESGFVGYEPFAVLLGDDIVDNSTPCLKQLIDAYDEYKTSILGVQEVSKEDTDKYRILDVKHIEDRVYKVKDMIEKPNVEDAPSNIAILGRYIITPTIFDILENQQPGKGGEIQLTDALKTLGSQESIYAYNFEGRRYDVGDKLGFLEATIDFALKRPELRKGLIEYIKNKVGENNTYESILDEVCVTSMN